MVDSGAAFADRGNGFSYGWGSDNSANVRARGAASSPDQRYDSLAQLRAGSEAGAAWELALPNGSYRVHLVAGDPSAYDGVYSLDLEGKLVLACTPQANDRWCENEVDVQVSDGRLTLTNGSGGVNNKVCYIEISGSGVKPAPGSGDETPPPAAEPEPEPTTPEPSEPPPSDADAEPEPTPPPSGSMVTPGNPGAVDVSFDIRSDRDVHRISPLIYGTNGAKDIANTRQTLVRLGGNRWTAYNWENNASNAGSDYYYQNDSYLSSSSAPGDAVYRGVETARKAGAATLVTVPIVDYVAADTKGGGDVRDSGANYLSTRFKQNHATKGAAFSATPNVADGAVYQDEFVSWLKNAEPNANILFSLDNEPDLWSDTHPEVHPSPVGYAELVKRNSDYAKAIKAVWPGAKVVGPVSYGWYGFVTLQDAPDGSGNGEFIDYYLTQMRAAERAAGKRLVDYLDLHWYPEVQAGGARITGSGTSSAVVSAREQAPRSLWDPSYTETSWITGYLGEPLRLLKRMQDKIAANYPGTGLAITEWNYGGGGHISGAIATADVLGIFGRENVGLANFWELSEDESYTYAAFRAFRNFDGAGATFGDTSIQAANSDVSNASVYASIDAARPSRMVVVAINKSSAKKTAGIKVAHTSAYSQARVYTLTASGPSLKPGSAVSAVATNAFRYEMPAQSVSVLVFDR